MMVPPTASISLRGRAALGRLAFAALVFLSACASCDANPDAGLFRKHQIIVPFDITGSPHLTEVLKTSSGMVVAANTSNVLFYADDAEQGLRLLSNVQPGFLRCVTIAIHEATSTLYCASIDFDGVVLIDLATRQLRQAVDQSGTADAPGFGQIHVHGSYLYLAAMQRGLLRQPILEGGKLGPIETVLTGEVVGVAGDGAMLAVLDRNRGLVGLRPSDSLEPVFTLPLDGPTVGLKVHGTKATIAMGSRGAMVVDLETQQVVAEVHPPCVVFSADATDSVLALGCSTAALAYDLTGTTPRLFGYDTAVYGFTAIRILDGMVFGADWRLIDLFRLNPTGKVLQVDVLAGLPLGAKAKASLVLRNFGASTLETDQGVKVPAEGTASWQIPVTDNAREDYLVSTEDEPLYGREVFIVRNENALKLGDVFPIEARSRYVTFVEPDCALQWPVLEDLVWLSKHGGLPGGLQPLVITLPTNEGSVFQTEAFPKLWGLEMKPLQSYFPGQASMQTFNDRFSKTDQINGGDITSDWSVDAEGTVIAFDRIYRGAHPLR